MLALGSAEQGNMNSMTVDTACLAIDVQVVLLLDTRH